VRSLEILAPLTPEGKSLLQVLGRTATRAGYRLLRQWLIMPLRRVERIEERLNKLQALYDHPEQHEKWFSALKEVGDLERRVARLSARRSTPRELAQVYRGLHHLLEMYETLPHIWHTLDSSVARTVVDLIGHYLEISPEPPYTGEKPGTGDVIREGVDSVLDRARSLLRDSEAAITALRDKEQQRTGIRSLKIASNRHIGYYIEIPPAPGIRYHPITACGKTSPPAASASPATNWNPSPQKSPPPKPASWREKPPFTRRFSRSSARTSPHSKK
jgi:DNA mismatch repair protein MutS